MTCLGFLKPSLVGTAPETALRRGVPLGTSRSRCARHQRIKHPVVREARNSNAGIPFVISICPIAAAAAGNVFEALNDLDPHDALSHLVAELALEPQAERSAVWDAQWRSVHVIGKNGLGMKCIDQVDALVIFVF